jgi:hypothetical protein
MADGMSLGTKTMAENIFYTKVSFNNQQFSKTKVLTLSL